MSAWNATCVTIGGRGVLIEGASGTGKSALALALMDRGARLVGDDGVLLSASGDSLIARPHPNTRGLLEIRNLGLLRFDVCEQVELALLIAFDEQAPRYVDAAPAVDRLGLPLPRIAIRPEACPPALKVEHALRVYGLPARSSPGQRW